MAELLEGSRLLLAIGLPWLAGSLLIRALPLSSSALPQSVVLGYGYFLGMLLVGLLLRLSDALGLGIGFVFPVALLLVISAAAYGKSRSNAAPSGPQGQHWRDLDRVTRALIVLLVAYLVARYAQIWLDIMWRPLVAWDAWTNWAPKAKVWFYEGRLVDFVAPGKWLLAETWSEVRTLVTWRYPEAVPLSQLWMALAVGHWDDLSINLPWFFCAPALGLALFGQLRVVGVTSPLALSACAVLLMLPFFNVHTYLAGYADIWMAAWLCLAAMALWNHARRPDREQLWLFWISTVACTQIKVPGLPLALFLVAALVLSQLPARRFWILLAASIVLTGSIFLVGIDWTVPGLGRIVVDGQGIMLPFIGEYQLEFHDVSPAVLANIFLLGNWHILWYVLPVALLWLPGLAHRSQVATGVVMLLSYFLVFGVFFFTGRYTDAVNYSSLSRATLYLVPLSIYWFAYLYAARGEHKGL